jgi:hypothetical protein
MDISSNYTAPLTLPNGQTIPSRGSVTVDAAAWKDMADHVIVKAWFDSKMLIKGKEPADEADLPVSRPGIEAATDEDLRLILKDNGITGDGRWGREKLMAEVKKLQVKDAK